MARMNWLLVVAFGAMAVACSSSPGRETCSKLKQCYAVTSTCDETNTLGVGFEDRCGIEGDAYSDAMRSHQSQPCDRIAETYDEYFASSPLFRYDCRFLDEYLSPPGPVLDLGCGTGRHLLHLERCGIATTGLDLNPHMLREAQAASALERRPCRVARADFGGAHAKHQVGIVGRLRQRFLNCYGVLLPLPTRIVCTVVFNQKPHVAHKMSKVICNSSAHRKDAKDAKKKQ